jgi:molecular chaperone GrpE
MGPNKDNNGEKPPSASEPSKEQKIESNGSLETPAYVSIPQEELEQFQNAATEYKDKYLRQLAEMENMRKRLQKEKQELILHAVQNVIAEFLAPIDHMENALKYTNQMKDDVKTWATGFQMILAQFKEVLGRHGVIAYTSEGAPFDPHLHEAVEMVITTKIPPGMVVSESIRGYKMGERVIRPARVTVSKAPETVEEKEQDKKNHESK